MTRAAPTDGKSHPIPGRIGGVLIVLQTLIAHARYFVGTVADRIDVPEFAAVAAIFGTYDLLVIRHRLQRGMLRALALQRYLLARAARGRNLRFAYAPTADIQPHHRPPPRPAPASRRAPAPPQRPDPATLCSDNAAAWHMPTEQELDAWVRRRPIGRTIAFICMDLGVVPGLCGEGFWWRVDRALLRYGGSLNRLYQVRAVREQTFQRERDKRPDTWHIDWRQMPRPALRLALGCLIGEAPPDKAVPTAVPS